MTAKPENNYLQQIERAEHLKTIYPFATEILIFYGRICASQKELGSSLKSSMRGKSLPSEGTLREQIDVDRVLPFSSKSLTEIAAGAPELIAQSIRDFLRGSQNRRAGALQRYVDEGGKGRVAEDSREELLARVLIDPYAEFLARTREIPGGTIAGNRCPKCEGRPVVGVRRTSGGKRFLLCAFCATEWEFGKSLCAFCGETREEKLPLFVAEKFPHLRVEACDTCRHFLRTVDMSKDRNAVAVVDDLAAIPLALWAEEYGYQRIHRNLLGT